MPPRASRARKARGGGEKMGMVARAGPPTRVPLRACVHEVRLLEAVAGLLPLVARADGALHSADLRPLMSALLRAMLNPREAGNVAARIRRCVQACLAAQEADALARLRQGYMRNRQRLEDACRQLAVRWRWDGGERGRILAPLVLAALDAGLEHCAARAMSRALCEIAGLLAAEAGCRGMEPLPMSRARLYAALRIQAAHVQVLKAPRESIAQFIGRAVQCLPDVSLGALAGAAAQAGDVQAVAPSQPFSQGPPDDGGLARHLPKLLFLAAADAVRDRLKARVITVAGAMRAEIDAGGDPAAALRLAWGRCRHAMEQMRTHAIVAAGVSLPDAGMLMADLLRLGGNSLEPGLLYRIYEGLPQALAAREDAVQRRLLSLALRRAHEVARKTPWPHPGNGNRPLAWAQLRELAFLRDMPSEAAGIAPPCLQTALRRARNAAPLDSLDDVMAMSDHEFGCFRAATVGLALFGANTRARVWHEGYARRIAVSDEALRAGAQRLLQLLRLPQVGVDALLRALRDLAEIVYVRNTRSEALGLLATDVWRDVTTREHADAVLAQATARTGWDHAVAALAGPAAPLAMRALRAAHGGSAHDREAAFEWPAAGQGRRWRLRTAIVWLEAVHAALWHRWMRLAGVAEWAASQLSAPPGWSGSAPACWPAVLRAALAGEFGVALPERPALPPQVLGLGVERAFLHACAVLPARLLETGKRAAPRCVRYPLEREDGAGTVLQVCRDFLADALDRVCLSFSISGVSAQGVALRAALSPWAGVDGGRDAAVAQALQALLLLAGSRDTQRLTLLLNRVLMQPVWRVLAMVGRDAPICMGGDRAYLTQDSSGQIHVDAVRLPDGGYRLDVVVCFEQLRCVDVEAAGGGRRRVALDPHVSRVCVTYAVQADPGLTTLSYLIGSSDFRYRLLACEQA